VVLYVVYEGTSTTIHYLVDMSSLLTDSLFGVKGYVAVVTGGASGLGFMIARVGASS
jgi:hypothetical protein